VSGRPATFLAEHAAVPGVRYLGLYGLQEIQDDVVRVHLGHDSSTNALIRRYRRLRQAADPLV
jgi:hypothetical protein